MPSRHQFRPAHRAPRSWRHVVAAGVALVAAGSVVGAAHPAAAEQVFPVPSSGTYTVTGHGFGHGNGMSQYGAKGAATRGLTAKQITDFYYPGTAYAANPHAKLRVRLSAVDARPVSVAAASGLVATDGAGKRWPLTTAGTTAWRFSWTPAKKLFALQKLSGGAYTTVDYAPGPLQIGGPSAITVQFGRAKNDCKRLSSVTYAGTLRTITDGGIQRSSADLPMEYYLRGVVPSESPASWPAAALQAQSVAARSYAAYKVTPSRWFDSYDTTQDQCWDGAAAHAKTTDAAIAATAGKIRTYGGKPAFTQFSSSNGGQLATGSVPYLKSKADPYEQYSGNPNTTWTKSVSAATFRSMAGLATVTRVRVTARDGNGRYGGRVQTLVVDGTNSAGKAASRSFTGLQVRLTLGLRSTYFTLGTPAASAGSTPAKAAPLVPRGDVPMVWRASARTWYPKGGPAVVAGTTASTPLDVDTDGDGRAELATFDRRTGQGTLSRKPFQWGRAGDVPVAGDITGDGRSEVGVFRPSTGQWFFRGHAAVTLGRKGDLPVLRDYDGNGKADRSIFRPSNGTWYRAGAAPVVFGRAGDIPVPADYNGDGKAEIAVYRPSTGQWLVRGQATVQWGARGDIPVPGDYNGDGKAEMMRYRPSAAAWLRPGAGTVGWGSAARGDVPVTPLA
jgi:stage II sporulation protein D